MPSLTMGTLNVRGSEGEAGLRRFLHRFRVNTKTKQKLGVMCIQEHMLPQSKHDSLMQLIKMKDLGFWGAGSSPRLAGSEDSCR